MLYRVEERFHKSLDMKYKMKENILNKCKIYFAK